MKTVMILNGSVNAILKQAEELNNYSIKNFSKNSLIEAWILTDQDVNFNTISFSPHINCIKLVKVRTKHVAEEYIKAIIMLYEKCKPEIMIFGSEAFVSGLAVRVACRLKGSSCVGVKRNQYLEKHFIVEKMVYSNNLTAKFIMKNMPYCISIAKGFNHMTEQSSITDDSEAYQKLPNVETVTFKTEVDTEWIRSFTFELINTEEGLNTSKVVVAIGKGIGSKEKVVLYEKLAALMEGKLGASRPVVMNAWMPMERLIGASGLIIAPELCVAIGVSGAAAFTVGIEKSKFIIAINKDQEAPIFKIANVAICADCEEVAQALINKLNGRI
ncbi:MAG: hypothetical protein CVV02_03570 [Firmicutes bacterium HGW-Firmicutes-7]|nr:MAG: hypothetical protein CVV02_03570 [Firmicutes bacterium HGW-Firmicutes-7]